MDVHTHLNYQYPTALLQLPQQQAHASPPHQQQLLYYQQAQGQSYAVTGSYIAPRQGPSMINPNASHPTGSYDVMMQHSRLLSQGREGYPGSAHPNTDDFLPGSISDKYIPSSTDKITCSDHRPLDEIFASVYTLSSISRHIPPGSRGPQPPPPSRHVPVHSHPAPQRQVSKQHGEVQQQQGHPVPPVLTYLPPSKPQLKGVLQIPLHAVNNHMTGMDLIVNYRCSDWGIGIQMEGISMTDLLYHHARGLERAHDRVLDGYGLTSIRLNIIWPYYPPFAKSISVFGTDGKPITRAGLGYEVSLAFAEFVYQIYTRSLRPTQPNPYSIALSQGSTTGVASGGIKFEQLHLTSVRNTSHGEWMAEVNAVVAPI
ncbi:hypothetical protein F5I97DRAFT_1929695 [Phlebopus sp. FC_14]|nr:hypothetical protein F5I97DRAFT_1929695 [Phlebopus sp. FC_14]